MDRFDTMRIFTRIVELKSFTRAADDLGYPKATVTHAIKQLEARLRVRLLQRTTRHVAPTPDGEAYYERCARLLADLEETESVFSGAGQHPRGKLRVDLQGTLGRTFVLPALTQFCARYPDIELEIGMGDRLADLVREGMDCVLRAGELRDSATMVGRRVASLEQVVCASPAYFALHGAPRTLADLDGQRAVNYLSAQSGRALPFEFRVDGVPRQVQLEGKIAVNNADAYVSCCLSGFGLIQAPRYHVAQALEQGQLREVLSAWAPEPMPVSVLYPRNRQLSARVRVFVDWLAEVFAPMR